MRNGDWMQTYSGKQFWPMDPKIDEIHIEDIAHALSNICRYGGHCRKFYSVAEHSCHVADAVPPQYRLDGLLDDAAEAYIGDMIRPIKYSIHVYQELDDAISELIRKRFGLTRCRRPEVMSADNAILFDESEQVMGGQVVDWKLPGKPLGTEIQFWSPNRAATEFLGRFVEWYHGS